jgi:hypothetical protein
MNQLKLYVCISLAFALQNMHSPYLPDVSHIFWSTFNFSVAVETIAATPTSTANSEKVVTSACGDLDDDDDDEMEQEEMFVDAHESFEHKVAEWGGPRRGGRLLEPTRFGDWERKGRCSDF